jgi:hypothetical protein
MRKRAIFFPLFICLVLVSIFPQSGSGGTTGSDRRFVDNENGTLTDTQTGLMWQQTAGSTLKTLGDAHSYVKSLSLAGFTDWRLPWRAELLSLVRERQPDGTSWLLSQGFKNILAADYWSGSYFHYIGLDYGWAVNASHGGTFSQTQDNRSFVWAVRGKP